MKTRQRVTDHGDDRVVIKSNIPRTLWVIVKQFAGDLGILPIQAWTLLLNRIAKEIEAGNIDFLGTDLASVAKGLSMKNEIGVEGMPPIDFGKLHRSDKLKSGFVGVYANGQGFRAMGKHPSGTGLTYVGTYPTAEQAAWSRYLHYQKHGFAYGDREDAIAKFLLEAEGHRNRFLPVKLSDTELVAFVDEEAKLGGFKSMTEEICELGIKWGGVDGTVSQKPMFEPFRDDGTDEDLPDPKPRPKRELSAEELDRIRKVTSGVVDG